jgi:excisionase family DNA binding protein
MAANRHVPLSHVVPTVTVAQAAETLGISRGTAYAAVRTGELPSIRVGRRLLVPTAALRQLLHLDRAAEGVLDPGTPTPPARSAEANRGAA